MQKLTWSFSFSVHQSTQSEYHSSLIFWHYLLIYIIFLISRLFKTSCKLLYLDEHEQREGEKDDDKEHRDDDQYDCAEGRSAAGRLLLTIFAMDGVSPLLGWGLFAYSTGK